MRKHYVAFAFFCGIRFVVRGSDGLALRISVKRLRTRREYSVSCSADFLCFVVTPSFFWSRVRGSIRKCELFFVALFVLPGYKEGRHDDRIVLPSLGSGCFILYTACEDWRQANAHTRKLRSLGTRREDHQESSPSFGSCAHFQFTALQFPLMSGAVARAGRSRPH